MSSADTVDAAADLIRERIRELAATLPDPDLPPALEPVSGTGLRTAVIPSAAPAVIPSAVEGSALLPPPAFLIWQNGEYALESGGARRTIRVSGLAEPANNSIKMKLPAATRLMIGGPQYTPVEPR